MSDPLVKSLTGRNRGKMIIFTSMMTITRMRHVSCPKAWLRLHLTRPRLSLILTILHKALQVATFGLWTRLDKQYKKHEDGLRVLLCKALITSQIFNYAWRWAIATPARPRCPPVAGRMDWRGHREISTSGKCAWTTWAVNWGPLNGKGIKWNSFSHIKLNPSPWL